MDRGLVERARDGDREAYELLVHHVGRPLFRVAHRILRDLDAAEDAVQRALVDIWRDLPNLRDLDRFDAWTYRLVVRASLDEARQLRRHAHVRELPPDGPSTPDTSGSLATRDALERAFDRLKPEQRAVVVLHHHAGFPLTEIATIMGVPYGTVGSRLHYALRELRAALGADETMADPERVAMPGGTSLMTGPAGFDRTLTEWLDDAGAQDIPPRVIDAAIDRARHTRRARPLPDFITRFLPMTTNFAAAPPLSVARPRPLTRLGPVGAFIALALLALALIGVALLTVGSPPPTAAVRNGLIGFDAGGDVWLVEGDGTDLRRLSSTPAQETSPIWSPDGDRLAIWTNVAGVVTVVITDADGGVQTTISAPDGSTFQMPGTGDCNAMARWSPDGSTLAATAVTSSDVPAVAILDVATGAGHALDVGMRVCGFAWSPVGSTLLLTGGAKDAEALYVSQPDGSGLRRLSSEGPIVGIAADSPSAFTPDGTSIAAERYESPEVAPDVVLIGLDGTQTTLVGGPKPAQATSVSPDGSLLSYIEAPAGAQGQSHATHKLFVVRTDADTAPQLVSDGVCGCSATWSPDGTRLATWTPDWNEVLILDVNAVEQPVHVPSPGNVGVLSWQPRW